MNKILELETVLGRSVEFTFSPEGNLRIDIDSNAVNAANLTHFSAVKLRDWLNTVLS